MEVIWKKMKVFRKAIRENKKTTFLVLVVLFGFFYVGYAGTFQKEEAVTTYKTEAVGKGDITVSVSGSGQVYAVGQVDLKPVKAGDGIEVVSVNVKNDQQVKKNQVVAVLDTRDASKSIRDAELALESANLRYEQIKDDIEEDKADSSDKKQQKITLEQKENALVDAKENLSDYYIKAPFDGIITGLGVETGDSASRDTVIASIITEQKYAKISLNEVDAAKVKTGNKAKLAFDALSGIEIEGEVSKMDTIGTVNQGVVSYDVEISFDYESDFLKPGMSVSAEITTASREDALTVPNSALKNQDGKQYVEVLQNSSPDLSTPEVFRKFVEVGLSNETSSEIISGLGEREVIITQTIAPSDQASAQPSQQGNILNSLGGSRGTGGATMRVR